MNRPRNENHETSETFTLWEFVSISDFERPIVLSTDAARQKWRLFKRLFTRADESSTPIKPEDALQTLSEARLDQLAPPIDRHAAVDALDRALEDWLQTRPNGSPVKFIIGQAFSANEEALARWTARHNARLITKPTVEQILENDSTWPNVPTDSQSLWVLPNLDKCFLRHAEGLSLIRRFLALALNGDLGPGIIGCADWSWTYLRRVCSLSNGNALTLQAFDGKRLSALFSQLASSAQPTGLQFLNANTGKTVLSDSREENLEVSKDLNKLAMRCRGNAEIARLFWRDSLRNEPEEATLEDSTPTTTVWVGPFTEGAVIPGSHDENVALILHALLIHNGLPAKVLTRVLPFSDYQIMDLLFNLKSLGVVHLQYDNWHVAPMGYLSSRHYLSAQNFLLDDF
jgi:hypothetical protein